MIGLIENNSTKSGPKKGIEYGWFPHGDSFKTLGTSNPIHKGAATGNKKANFSSESIALKWNHRYSNTTAAANQSNEVYEFQKQVTAVGEGFNLETKLCFKIPILGRCFAGLSELIVELPDATEIATQTNIIGIGKESSDTNLQVIHNDNSGFCTKIDLGDDFKITGGYDCYNLIVENIQFENSISVTIINLNNQVSKEVIIQTDLPATTVGLAPKLWSNTGTSSELAHLLYDYLKIN